VRIRAILALFAVSAVVASGASAFGIDLENPPTPGVVGMPYKYVFIPKNGAPPFAFWLDVGELPPGLKIDPDGTMQGTPQAPGTWEFTVAASQCCGPDTQWGTSVTIRDRLNITTAALPAAVLSSPYSAPIAVVGNGGRGMGWTLTSGALPPGLTLAADGTPADTTVSGTPTVAGMYTFTVKVGDTDGFLPDRSITKQFTIAVAAKLSAAGAQTLPTGIQGKPYNAMPATASGGLAPLTWSVASGALPPGLALDPATGVVRGRPTGYGTFTFALRVSDASGQSATANATITIVRTLDLRTTRLRAGTVGHSYSATLRSVGGQSPLRYAVTGGKLATGLKLNAKTGVISGKPKQQGDFRFRATVTDALGQRSSERISLAVHA
jgi:Putative Ig domain